MVIVSADSAVTNTTGATDDDEDINLDDLFGDLFDEDGEDMSGSGETSTGETSTGTNTSVKAGDLEVTLNPTSPASATVPGAISGLPVAKFDFTAGSTDVKITSVTLKRVGLSKAATLTALALFNESGRISKAKDDTQNNNTEAYITLDNGGVVVKAGSTMTITVVADVATKTTTSGDEFAIQLLSVESSAANVDGLSNLVASTMKVG
jgi:hypothetical protein